jgi:hypothetical protein
LVRWPLRQAVQHAGNRVREITARERLLLPVEDIVGDLNGFSGRLVGLLPLRNPAQFFDKITLHSMNRLATFVAGQRQRDRRFGTLLLATVHLLSAVNPAVTPPHPT